MSLREYYDDTYRAESGRPPGEMLEEVTKGSRGLFKFAVESKDRFLPGYDWQGLKVLEVGSGRGGAGLLLAGLGADVTLLDFSSAALAQAQSIYQFEGQRLSTVHGDVTHPDLFLPEKYDLILDSHLLHCLTENPDRASYYRLICDHLTGQGIFVAETMVHRKKLQIPDGFMFDERNVLWQMIGKWTPVRRILDSLELERELSEAQFNIAYFYYYAQLGFVPHKSFLDLPEDILPAAVRFVLQNKLL
ncbi:MAG TPA: class I SAM-dependent methyltransferase [Bacteriovoracaceae bacterium]|nr:class I SAM-dependent methyltransferase [Bacteriovoracaceae bacterium]